MDVRLPNGTVVRGVPDGTSKEAVMQKAIAAGLAKPEDFPQQPEPTREQYRNSMREKVLGFGEAALSMGSSVVAEPVAGLRGLAAEAVPGGQTGAEAVESTREAMRYEPRTETGQQYMGNVAETLAPVAETIRDVEEGLGGYVLEKTGSPALATAAHTFPTVVLEALGLATARGGISATRRASNRSTRRAVDKAVRESAPDTEALRASADALYREIDELGGVVKPNAARRFTTELVRELEKKGVDSQATPAAHRAMTRLMEEVGSIDDGMPLTLGKLETVREVAKSAASKLDNPHEASLGSTIRSRIDDFLDNAGPQVIDAPDAAAIGPRYKAARALWGQMRRGEVLEEAFYKASNQATGFENGLRAQLRSIINNKKTRKMFSPDELDLMKKVVDGSATTNTLKRLGKLGFGEGGASNMLGGGLASAAAYSVGGVPAALGVAGLGTLSRKLAQRMTANNAAMAQSVVRAGRSSKKIAEAYIRNTPKSARNANELAELFLSHGADMAMEGLDDFARKAAEIALQRQAELAAVAATGSGKEGTAQNVLPFARAAGGN